MFNRVWTKSRLYRVLFGVEEWFKKRVFGCHSCGQCVLRSTSFVCPQSCPKQMRNGPCGGSMFGKCEVFPERDCVWTKIHERSEIGVLQIFDMENKVVKIQPAVDWSLAGTSAGGSIIEGKTDRNGGILSPHPVPNAEIDHIIASSKA